MMLSLLLLLRNHHAMIFSSSFAFTHHSTAIMQQRSKFARPLCGATNNEVWVTWKHLTSGEFVADTVEDLNGGAKINNLCRQFAKQRKEQADERIDPVAVNVRETENGQVLRVGTPIKQYFVPPEGRGEGPGQSEETALFLTLPNVQQPQLPVVRNAILVFLLIGSVPWCTFKCPDRNSDTALVPTICYEIKSSSF